MIEDHFEKLRADPRRLSGRALRARTPEYPSKIAESGCPEWRPAQKPCAEYPERDGYRKLTLDAGKGGAGERHNAAADLDRAR